MQISRLKTRKLFYNKWPYKIECRLNKANYILRLGEERTEDWLNGDKKDEWLWKDASKVDIREFVNVYNSIKHNDIKVRSEGSHFNIFLKDKDLVDNIVTLLNKWIYIITEPSSDREYEFLISNTSKKVICNSLPKEKYRYKIYINTKMSINTRERFYEWMNRYDTKFNVSNSTKDWLIGRKGWIQSPFFYVDDQPTLSMVGMYLGNNVKRVEEFIPRDKINI